MSRYRSSGSKCHAVHRIGPDHYRLSWSVDFYYAGVRGRFPRVTRRDTDYEGACRFAKKWDLPKPERGE